MRGSVALIGDAAHAVSPVTGAGFQNGLLDIRALSAALAGRPPDEVPGALERYQRARLEPARGLVTTSREWSRAFAS